MDRLIQNFRYRPEVDGLRAVAVMAVVLFHAGLGCPGGYVGVDVFFVISGYLITSLIVADLQRGEFTFARFWERRARRIIPALVTVALATLVAGWFLLLPREYAELGKSAASLSVFGANIYFWIVNWTGYFAISMEETPLLHTWSLAVEEQFYLIAPLTLFAMYKFSRLRTQRHFLALFGAGAAVSFLASVYGVARHPVAAFYLLPTRAWELLLGSMLAVFPSHWTVTRPAWREVLSYLGLAGIVCPCLLYSRETPFPGLAALPPCLGTAFILLSGSSTSAVAPLTSLGRLLAARPVVFVGLISYSLYLYHWPVFAFSKYYLALEPLGWGWRLGMIAVSFVLAILSWRFVETPFRRKTVCSDPRDIYRWAAGALAALCLVSLGIQALHGFPQRMPDRVRTAFDPANYRIHNLTVEDIAAGRLVAFGTDRAQQPVKVVLWGDSHASAALPAFDAALKARQMSGLAAIHAATAPVVGYFKESYYGLGGNALRFNEEVIAYVEKHSIPHVVLIASWSGYDSEVHPALLKTLRRLVAARAQPWVFLQVPFCPYDVSTLCRHFWEPLPDLNQSHWCAQPGGSNGVGSGDMALLDQIRKTGAHIIDPRPAFLNAKGDRYVISLDGVILYSDREHLTRLGAEKVVVPVLEKALLPYL